MLTILGGILVGGGLKGMFSRLNHLAFNWSKA